MIRNYLKTAWRNLLKNRFYSLINLAGLSIGLAIGVLILLWVQDELSFDGFHRNAGDIYRLEIAGGTGASKQIFTMGVAPIGPFAKQELPEVKEQVRIKNNYDFSLYKYQDKVFGDQVAIYADPTLFSLFDFPLIEGNSTKPFTDNGSVVITQSAGKRFFGNEDPVGKVIVADKKVNWIVSGVIRDFPMNSTIQADLIMPMEAHLNSMLVQGSDMSNNFSILDYITFLLVKPGSSIKQLANDILKIHLKHKPDDTDAEYLLLPLKKMHLYNADMTDRGMSTVRIFILIGILTLLIACINYVNLSTARSLLRAKEISMRKISGAGKGQLFFQFILETTMIFTMASILAIALAEALMPIFNQLSGKALTFDLKDYHIWLLLLGSILGTLILSSIYPALLLSSFDPIKALKGKTMAGIGNGMARKTLVVVQFTFSVVLIVGTMVINSQLHYIKTKGIGYDKNYVLSFWMRDMSPHFDAVKAELMKQPGVLGVTRSNQNIIHFEGFSGDVNWEGKDPKQNLIIHPLMVDDDLIPFFKMRMVQGNNFSGFPADSTHFILNETALKESGIKDPIGKRFDIHKIQGTIIGIIQDFHFTSMKEKISPVLFAYIPQYADRIYVRTSPNDAKKVIAAASAVFARYNEEYPFNYAFLDDAFNNLYKSEQQEGSLFSYFSLIAIFISCLGLFGLATYTAQVRTREIGIRKVLGAGIGNIASMMSFDFLKLVLISAVIGIPIAWWGSHQWLEGFAYRTDLHWWLFGFAGLLTIVVAWLTVGWQAFRAAIANPVKSLRLE